MAAITGGLASPTALAASLATTAVEDAACASCLITAMVSAAAMSLVDGASWDAKLETRCACSVRSCCSRLAACLTANSADGLIEIVWVLAAVRRIAEGSDDEVRAASSEIDMYELFWSATNRRNYVRDDAQGPATEPVASGQKSLNVEDCNERSRF